MLFNLLFLSINVILFWSWERDRLLLQCNWDYVTLFFWQKKTISVLMLLPAVKVIVSLCFSIVLNPVVLSVVYVLNNHFNLFVPDILVLMRHTEIIFLGTMSGVQSTEISFYILCFSKKIKFMLSDKFPFIIFWYYIGQCSLFEYFEMLFMR